MSDISIAYKGEAVNPSPIALFVGCPIVFDCIVLRHVIHLESKPEKQTISKKEQTKIIAFMFA